MPKKAFGPGSSPVTESEEVHQSLRGQADVSADQASRHTCRQRTGGDNRAPSERVHALTSRMPAVGAAVTPVLMTGLSSHLKLPEAGNDLGDEGPVLPGMR